MDEYTITAIKAERSRNDRVCLFINGNPFLRVRREVVVKAKLRVGQVLSSEELDALRQEEQLGYAKDLAVKYLATRPRTTYQLRVYLARKGFSDAVIQQVLHFLSDYGYIDDKRYAEGFIRSRMQDRPRSERMLRFELQQKGIADEVIDEVLASACVDDQKTALALARARLAKMRDIDERVLVRRLGSFLARRGYRMGTIQEILRTIRNTSNLDND
jgi:regulatory protein